MVKPIFFSNVDKEYDSGDVIFIPIHIQSTKTAEEKHWSTVLKFKEHVIFINKKIMCYS